MIEPYVCWSLVCIFIHSKNYAVLDLKRINSAYQEYADGQRATEVCYTHQDISLKSYVGQ